MLQNLTDFIEHHKNINDKSNLANLVKDEFKLTKDRSVFYNSQFAIRFSKADSVNFGNTVLSLSRLQKYDNRPFFICLVLRDENILLLANSTFLKKISHSSQLLRVDNIRGSFNGSDIFRVFGEIRNSSENFDELFEIHRQIPFEENLIRLVESTNEIVPTGNKFEVLEENRILILESPQRAKDFSESEQFLELKVELDNLVEKFQNEILIASLIENVNTRGNIIEYLITGKDEELKQHLISSLQNRTDVPRIQTDHELGDYIKIFGDIYHTATDIKTKIMILNSNPKAYNLDKMLSFFSHDNSVFMFYFVGIDFNKILNPVLVSMFHDKVLNNTIFIKHWAGRNSRGVSQLNGAKIKELFTDNHSSNINLENSVAFLKEVIDL
jgi:hypothetical protein